MRVVAENYEQTDRQTHTRDNYRNLCCACTPRVNDHPALSIVCIKSMCSTVCIDMNEAVVLCV